MKCELCDADATFHATEVDANGDAVSRSLCEGHARESGYPLPVADVMDASVPSDSRSLIDFLRKHRRMPSPNELMGMGGATGPQREDSAEDVDGQASRLPPDGENDDPV